VDFTCACHMFPVIFGYGGCCKASLSYRRLLLFMEVQIKIERGDIQCGYFFFFLWFVGFVLVLYCKIYG